MLNHRDDDKREGAVQYQIPTVVGSTEINLTAPLTHSAFPTPRANAQFFSLSSSSSSTTMSTSTSTLCARASHVRNYWRPSIDSFRAGFVERTSERTNEPASRRANEWLSKVGYISSASESRSPVSGRYHESGTKASLRLCLTRITVGADRSAAGIRILEKDLSLSLSLCVSYAERKRLLRERPQIRGEIYDNGSQRKT